MGLMNAIFRDHSSNPFVYDIPVGLRRLAWTAGLCAVVVVVVASLEGGQDHTVEVDKLLHFGGYAVLGMIFTMSLRPGWIPPCLLLLFGLGVGIEMLQPLNGRTRDVTDAIANTVGLVSGCSIGIFLRVFARHFFTAVKGRRWRKSLFTHERGEVLVEQGAVPEVFYIIRSGRVELLREDGQGHVSSVTEMNAGQCIAVAAVLKEEALPVSIRVAETSEIYHIRKEQFYRQTGDESEALKFLVLSMADTITSVTQAELHLVDDSC